MKIFALMLIVILFVSCDSDIDQTWDYEFAKAIRSGTLIVDLKDFKTTHILTPVDDHYVLIEVEDHVKQAEIDRRELQESIDQLNAAFSSKYDFSDYVFCVRIDNKFSFENCFCPDSERIHLTGTDSTLFKIEITEHQSSRGEGEYSESVLSAFLEPVLRRPSMTYMALDYEGELDASNHLNFIVGQLNKRLHEDLAINEK